MKTRFVTAIVLMMWGASATYGQAMPAGSYPQKALRVVTGSVGGAGDFGWRLLLPGLTEGLGQAVITDNRSSSVIPGQIVSQAPPDGYTLLFFSGTLWIGPLMQKAPYDAIKDFSPIVLATMAPNLFVVHPAVAANSVKELIALAKAKPGQLNYTSGGIGSSVHIAGELFRTLADVNVVRIPYTGSGQALNALIGGQVQIGFAPAGSAAPHVKSGRLRALAVTSAQPSVVMPSLPTVAASGLPGYEAVALNGLLAPVNTPVVIIKRLNQEMVRALGKPDVKEKFLNTGVETIGGSPQQFAATIKSDVAKLGKLIKDAGIQTE